MEKQIQIISNWELEKYSSTNRINCPKCDGKKTFTRFVTKDTNGSTNPRRFGDDVLENDLNVGACGRKDKCGHYKHPFAFYKEFFPEKITKKDNSQDQKETQERKILPKQEEKINYIQPKIINHFKKDIEQTALWHYLVESKKMDQDIVRNTFEDYNIGHLPRHENSTLLPIQDAQGNFRTGKIYQFDKEKGSVLKTIKEDGQKLRQIFWLPKTLKIKGNFQTCYFGQHLLTKYPKKPVALVESERTAIYMSCLYPQYNWLATMAMDSLNNPRIKSDLEPFLMENHKVFLFSDKGQEQKWVNKIKDSNLDFFIFDGFKDTNLKKGADIEDLLNSDSNFKLNKQQFKNINKNGITYIKLPRFQDRLLAYKNFVLVHAGLDHRNRRKFNSKNIKNIQIKNTMEDKKIRKPIEEEKNFLTEKIELAMQGSNDPQEYEKALAVDGIKIEKIFDEKGEQTAMSYVMEKDGEEIQIRASEINQKNIELEEVKIDGIIDSKTFLNDKGQQVDEKEATQVEFNIAKVDIQKEQFLEATLLEEPQFIENKKGEISAVVRAIYQDAEGYTKTMVYFDAEGTENAKNGIFQEGDLVVLNREKSKEINGEETFYLENIQENINHFKKEQIDGVVHEKIFLNDRGDKVEEKEATQVEFQIAVPKKEEKKTEEKKNNPYNIKPIDAFELYGLKMGIYDYKKNKSLQNLQVGDVVRASGSVQKNLDGTKEFKKISGGLAVLDGESKARIIAEYNKQKNTGQLEKKEIDNKKDIKKVIIEKTSLSEDKKSVKKDMKINISEEEINKEMSKSERGEKVKEINKEQFLKI